MIIGKKIKPKKKLAKVKLYWGTKYITNFMMGYEKFNIIVAGG